MSELPYKTNRELFSEMHADVGYIKTPTTKIKTMQESEIKRTDMIEKSLDTTVSRVNRIIGIGLGITFVLSVIECIIAYNHFVK